jgi:hypothetical protein
MLESSWVAAQLPAFQEGLSSVSDWVIFIIIVFQTKTVFVNHILYMYFVIINSYNINRIQD